MYITKFPIILTQSVKTSTLMLWNDTRKEIIEGTFTRNSGAVITNPSGELELIPSNVPSFSYLDGGVDSGDPVIRVMPTSTNQVRLSPSFLLASSVSNSIVQGDGVLKNLQVIRGTCTGNISAIAVRYALSSGLPNPCTLYYELFYKTSVSNLTSIRIDLGDSVSVIESSPISDGDWNKYEGTVTNSNSWLSGYFIDIEFTGMVNGDVVDYILCASESLVNNGFIIPATSGTVVRANEKIEFTDLVNKNVLSSNEWSVFIDINFSDAGSVNNNTDSAAFILFTGSGLDLYIRYIGSNNGLNIYDQDGSVTILNVGSVNRLIRHKMILTYKDGVTNFYLDSVKIGNGYNKVFNITGFYVSGGGVGLKTFSEFRKIALSPVALTDSEAIDELNRLN